MKRPRAVVCTRQVIATPGQAYRYLARLGQAVLAMRLQAELIATREHPIAVGGQQHHYLWPHYHPLGSVGSPDRSNVPKSLSLLPLRRQAVAAAVEQHFLFGFEPRKRCR